MTDIKVVFESVVRCLNEKRWDDLPKFIHPKFTLNGGEHTPESYATELKTAGDSEIAPEIVTVDGQSRRLGATILVNWKPCQPVMGLEPPTGKTIQFMDHLLVWFTDAADGGDDATKISKIVTLSDRDAIHRQLLQSSAGSGPSSPDPEATSTLADIDNIRKQGGGGGGSEVDTALTTTTLGSTEEPPNAIANGRDLEELYRAYIDCINKRTMETDLPKFCHPRVFHNDQALSLDRYRHLMQDAIDAIPDISFGLHTLITDKEAQRVAARLEFTGTPIKAIQGVEPNGRPVHFAEHVTYQLRDGKIHRVWSIVDWVSYRQQLLGNYTTP
ncbi:hypothetical protein SLS62_008259 [Diatrype stigma]|uniref:SnoaL-like polyketide cyclase n=1 Tax=Diatrype stigma TaxID=117547 RepID=A0AAN9UMU0_9PEZI